MRTLTGIILGLSLVACATEPGDEETAETDQATTIGSWQGCTMYASISQQSRNGFGEISCGSYENKVEVEACLEQLVTGGWQTLNWTCIYYTNPNDHHYAWATTNSVPYWTTNRWYQTQVWARVNGGPWGYMTSEGLKGP